MRKTPQRILVIRTDRMGDLLLTLPAAAALRRSFPDAFLAMMVHSSMRELAEHCPDLNAVITDGPEDSGFRHLTAFIRKIRSQRFDVALIMHPTFRLAAAVLLAGIRCRIGTAYRFYSFLFNRPIREHRKYGARHEVEFNLSLAADLGADTGHPEFHLLIPVQARDRITRFFAENEIRFERPVVVIHPGSRGSALDWPPERFFRLAKRLVLECKAQVVISGNAFEKERLKPVFKETTVPIIDGSCVFSLIELAALMKSADLCIANSTGPLHLAVAVGTDVIGLYPPLRPASARRWGPYGREGSVIVPDLPECRKCMGRSCPHWNCMRFIEVDRVFQAACQKLAACAKEK